MSDETSNSSTGMGSSDSTAAKATKSGPNRGLLIGGLIAVVVIAGVVVSTNNSDAPRSGTAAECKESGINCTVGDIGPGGGKVFYVAATPFTCGPTGVSTCNYLEVAPVAWQDLRATATTTDLRSDLATAKSTVAAYSTTTATAGTWRLPYQAELTKLATLSSDDQVTVNGFRDVSSLYWSATTQYSVNTRTGAYTNSAYVRSIQNAYGQVDSTTTTIYARPIHPF